MDLSTLDERMTNEIKARAMEFALDNINFPTAKEIKAIENAMLIGAGIALIHSTMLLRAYDEAAKEIS